MRKLLVYCIAASSLLGLSASANIIVNGTGDSAITQAVTKRMDGDTAAGIVGGTTIDTGWITYSALTSAKWSAGAGSIVRTTVGKFAQSGFGQIVSNPLDGNFANGKTVTFSFDLVNGGGNQGFSYSVYGINGSGIWAANSLDSINLEDDTVSVGTWTGLNYTFTELVNVRDQVGGAIGGAISDNIALTADYSYFAVAFWTDLDSGSGVTIDNVSLSAIPEPATLGMVAFVGGSLIFIRRKFMV